MTNFDSEHSTLAGLMLKFSDHRTCCRVTSDNDVYYYCKKTGYKLEVDILNFEIRLNDSVYNMQILRAQNQLEEFEVKIYQDEILILEGEGFLIFMDSNQTGIKVCSETIYNKDKVTILKLSL